MEVPNGFIYKIPFILVVMVDTDNTQLTTSMLGASHKLPTGELIIHENPLLVDFRNFLKSTDQITVFTTSCISRPPTLGPKNSYKIFT